MDLSNNNNDEVPLCNSCGHRHIQGVKCSICGHVGKSQIYHKMRVIIAIITIIYIKYNH